MSQYNFGGGVIWHIPAAAINNNAPPSGIGGAGGGQQNYSTVAWRSAIRLGLVQEFSVDLELPTKILHGTGVFPIAVARGKGKIPIKIRDARLSAAGINVLAFGDDTNTITTPAGYLIAENEAGTIPTTPFQITVANSATFTRDLGVRLQSTGGIFSAAATSTGSGVYAVAAGVYTFNTADVGLKVFIDYEYQPASVAPYRIVINQQFMGETPSFILIGYGQHNGKQMTIELDHCTVSKLMLNLKLDDWLIPEIDGEAFCDAVSGAVGFISTGEL